MAEQDTNGAPRSFYWYSTPKSRAAGKVSALAVVETVLSVVAYWWFAIAFDTHIHLVTSVLVAPLLLLRSEASISRGSEVFERNYNENPDDRKTFTLVLIVLIAATCSGLVTWILAQFWLIEHTGWALFWRAALLGLLAINVSSAAMLAVTGIGAGAGAGAAAIAAAGVGAVAVAVAVAAVVVPGFALGLFIRVFWIRF